VIAQFTSNKCFQQSWIKYKYKHIKRANECTYVGTMSYNVQNVTSISKPAFIYRIAITFKVARAEQWIRNRIF
jgi:hypothetical protein